MDVAGLSGKSAASGIPARRSPRRERSPAYFTLLLLKFGNEKRLINPSQDRDFRSRNRNNREGSGLKMYSIIVHFDFPFSPICQSI